VEADIRRIFAQMRDIRAGSPLAAPPGTPWTGEQRQTLEKIVADPGTCRGRLNDQYCRVYEEVVKKKPGVKPQDVYTAFTAEEIIQYKLLGNVMGCTGDARVFHKLADELGLRVRTVSTSNSKDYYHACYAGGRKISRMKPQAHLNGHVGVAVGWGGKWRLLDSNDYEGPSYARSGRGGPELAMDRPEDFLGREVFFGDDPHVVTAVEDAPVFTSLDARRAVGADCRFAVSTGTYGPSPELPQPWTGCKFEGQAKVGDGLRLDFSCGRCFVPRVPESRFNELRFPKDASCSVTRHESNGLGDVRDCMCVSCGGHQTAFYEGGCE